MATFNQQNQTVQNQVNAETIHVDGGCRRLVEKIDDLLARIDPAGNDEDMTPVVDCLTEARAASVAGDRGRAVALLRRAAEVAGPAATIVTSILAVAQGVQ